MRTPHKILLWAILLLAGSGLFLLAGYHLTFAQTANNPATQNIGALGIAQIISVQGKDVKDGSIVSTTDHGAILSSTAYDPQVLGVVARDAAIMLGDENGDGVPVVSEGKLYVLVTTSAGKIKKGDLITTSTTPGVGMKAAKSGYVLGTALEDDSNPNTKQVDKIALDLNLHYFNAKPTLAGSLTDILKIALMPTKEGPSALFKYIVAAIVVLGSFVLAFMTFGRAAAKGVEALGRNPAASKLIHLGIIFNVFIVAMIVIAGLTVAFFILRL